jgi:hypothetical protein
MHAPAIDKAQVAVCRLLLDQLPAVWAGEAAAAAVPQDEALVTHAPKVCLPLQHAIAFSASVPSAVTQTRCIDGAMDTFLTPALWSCADDQGGGRAQLCAAGATAAQQGMLAPHLALASSSTFSIAM